MTQGQRNKHYVDGQHRRSRVHLVPFSGNMDITKITTGKTVKYRIHRHEQAIAKRGEPSAHSPMNQEIATLRQTLKTALRQLKRIEAAIADTSKDLQAYIKAHAEFMEIGNRMLQKWDEGVAHSLKAA